MPYVALMRHQLCHFDQYTFCVLPPTEASASVSTSLSTSSAFPPSPACVPAWRGGHIFTFLHFISLRSIPHQCTHREIRVVALYKNKRGQSPMSSPLHSPVTNDRRLLAISSFGHLEIPSAITFCTPGIYFATRLQPPVTSSLPSILIAKEARLSRDPPHLLTHDTATTLSPLNSTGSPSVSGLSCKMPWVTNAVITMPQTSSTFIVIASCPLVTVGYFSSYDRLLSRSYL